MLWTIQNERLSISVDTIGAQLMSLKAADGIEYLWQGDPQFWGERAPLLFPFIGRLTHNRYRLGSAEYPMTIHGFAKTSAFSLVEQATDRLVFELTDREQTRAQYPFSFALRITYRLTGDRLEISYRVENRSGCDMPFAIGGHPGFRVPLMEGERFEDYSIAFTQPCQPDRVGFTPSVYLSGMDERYPLAEDSRIDLRHDLFDRDAIILKNISREVTLRSRKTDRGLRVSYPSFPYLGIWHMPKTEAPYVCIEPWTSLPARQDVIEDFYSKSDMILLSPGNTYHNTWTITVL